MSLKIIPDDSPILQNPAFYNVYPIHNETSCNNLATNELLTVSSNVRCLDDNYGRLFDASGTHTRFVYGVGREMPLYQEIQGLDIIDTLRVPFRKIPVYAANSKQDIKQAIVDISKNNPSYKILTRGQSKTYYIGRSAQEKLLLFGDSDAKEPSFLPSHLRQSFDPKFLQCMWQSQGDILLNDLKHDCKHLLSDEKFSEFSQDAMRISRTTYHMPFSLGIAQHYGMPSVGLDLTDSVSVASWFATKSIRTNDEGLASISDIDLENGFEPTIFIFRCPVDAVFDYQLVKPRHSPDGRPDRQNAWFGHVGWGEAKNQLASYLCCAFRLTKKYLDTNSNINDEYYFPSREQDPILDYFLKMRGMEKYEGEAKRALSGVYYIK